MTDRNRSIRIRTLAAIIAASLAAPAVAASVDGVRRGPDPAAATAQTQEAGQRFVVKYREGSVERADKNTLARGLDAALARTGINRLAGPAAKSGQGAVTVKQLRRMAAPGWNVVRTSRLLSVAETRDFLRELAADPAVASVDIDRLYQHDADMTIKALPNDPRTAEFQWHFYDPTGGVRAEAAWELSQGEGAVVAVVDTGIVQNARDLAGNVLPGYDFLSDPVVSRRADGSRVPGGWDTGDWVEENYCVALGSGPHPAEDSSWHGSHVSGTIAQETNNGIALAGLAYKAKVVPVRVLGSCGGFGSDIADGIVWAAGGTVEGIPANANPAEIINMSLGSRGPSACPQIYQDAINEANSKGSIVVVAAGNSNGDAGTYTMSSCSGVISVAATGITGARASYSNWGTRVDLAAPGGGGGAENNGYVWQVINGGTTTPTDTWFLGGMAGTSMASPHVAAVAAMVQSVVETPLTWTQMRDLLKSTARAFPVAPDRVIGAGILDARKALEKATETPCNPDTEPCGPEVTVLVNGEAVRDITGNAGDEKVYSIEVPANTARLRVISYAGTGDVSLYAKFGAVPATPADAEFRSTRPGGNNEGIDVAKPKAGVYYIKLVGEAAFKGVNLQARY